MIRVLIADDETLMRAGIRLILENDPEITVVAEASDGRQAVELTLKHTVDVALLDIRMPGGDGLKAAEQIASRVSVVMLTTFGEDSYVAQALKVGATGFLLKDTPLQELINAVRKAARGEPILAPQITKRLIEKHLLAPNDGSDARRKIDALTGTAIRTEPATAQQSHPYEVLTASIVAPYTSAPALMSSSTMATGFRAPIR